MKVDNNRVGANVASTVDKAKADKTKVSSGAAGLEVLTGAGLANSAKVNVSDRAQAMKKAKEIASNQNVNEARVAELQKLIDQGKYKIDAKAIADRMVDEHMAMTEE